MRDIATIEADLRAAVTESRVIEKAGATSTDYAAMARKLETLGDELTMAKSPYAGLFGGAGAEAPPPGYVPRGTVGRSFGVTAQTGQAPPVSFGEDQIAELYSNLVSGKSVTIEAKATTASGSVPMSTVPDFRLSPVGYRREPTRVLNLLRTSNTDRAEVDYFRVTTPAAAAAAVAEGADKPESSLVYEKVVAAIRKVAHYIRVTDETLADYAGFLAVIREELLAGLVLEENNQLLNGTGIAPNLQGMLGTTGVLVQAKGTDTRNDAIMKAVTALRVGSSYAEADALVMNPTDYQSTVLEKDTAGRYIAGDPRTIPSYELWGLPVTVTTQIPVGTALVGAFKEAAEAYIRWAPRIEANSFGTGEWIANKTLIRCEERIGLAVTRPTALCKVTGL